VERFPARAYHPRTRSGAGLNECPPLFERVIEIEADDENADRVLAENELHRDETIVSVQQSRSGD